MAIFPMPIPAAVDPRDEEAPEKVAAFLKSKGITAKVLVTQAVSSSVVIGGRNAGITVSSADTSVDELVIDADADPTTAMQTYVDQPAPRALARVALAAALQEIRAKTPANRTPAERAVLNLAVLVRMDAG